MLALQWLNNHKSMNSYPYKNWVYMLSKEVTQGRTTLYALSATNVVFNPFHSAKLPTVIWNEMCV